MMIGLYRAATVALGPAISYLLARRLAAGKEDRARLPERKGVPGLARPDGPLLWVHAASVGEALSMLALVDALLARDPGLRILVTSGTVTSAAVLGQRLPERAFHQFVPVDRPAWVRRFFDHWRPCAILWAESEFWPNMLCEARKRGIPMVLVNGRISDRSFAKWQRFPGAIATLLGSFTLALGQTEEDRRRLEALGAAVAECLGNLKFAAPPLPADAAELTALRGALGKRPAWLAASTHAGEEALAGRVHRTLAADRPGLLTVVVPRHADRGPALAEDLRGQGLAVARRRAGEPVAADTDVYLADTMGELGLFFRLCPVAFMGKSIEGRGGQNPLEPARLGAAVLFGPHMDNFVELAARMIEANAARQVGSEAELADAVGALLDDAEARATMGRAAQAFAESETDALDRVTARLAPLIDQACRGDGR